MTKDEREIFVIDEYLYLTKSDKPVQGSDRKDFMDKYGKAWNVNQLYSCKIM